MKNRLLTVLLIWAGHESVAQFKFIDRAGEARFFSASQIENIEAINKQALSVLDIQTGEIQAAVLMKSFAFEKALMQEHFNENYVESDKYPKATFKGKILNLKAIDFTQEGTYVLQVEGEMSLHGVTRPVSLKAEANITKGVILATAEFYLAVKDFNIDIPRLVVNNISEKIRVNVKFRYQPAT
jgi:polyisoprenoid-binding protein YceI